MTVNWDRIVKMQKMMQKMMKRMSNTFLARALNSLSLSLSFLSRFQFNRLSLIAGIILLRDRISFCSSNEDSTPARVSSSVSVSMPDVFLLPLCSSVLPLRSPNVSMVVDRSSPSSTNSFFSSSVRALNSSSTPVRRSMRKDISNVKWRSTFASSSSNCLINSLFIESTSDSTNKNASVMEMLTSITLDCYLIGHYCFIISISINIIIIHHYLIDPPGKSATDNYSNRTKISIELLFILISIYFFHCYSDKQQNLN